MKRNGSSSKIVGQIRVPVGHKFLQNISQRFGIHRIVVADDLYKNGSESLGTVTILQVIDGGIRIRIHDTDASQDVFLASNEEGFETELRDYLAHRGKQ